MPPDNSLDDPRVPAATPNPPPQQGEPQPPNPTSSSPALPNLPSLNPQPSPNIQNQVPAAPDLIIPKSTKKIYFIGVAIFILIMISAFSGGIALAYNDYKIFSPPSMIKNTLDSFIVLSPLPKPTRIVLASTVAKSTSLKSADQKLEFKMSTTSKDSPISSLRMTLEGPVEFDNPNSQAAEADIGLEVKFEGASFNGAASVKTVQNTLYFKINEFPFGSIYQQYLSYKNKWFYYKIPDEYISKETNLAQNAKMQKLFSDFLEKSKSWTKISDYDKDTYLLEVTPPKDEVDKLIFGVVKTYEPKDTEDKKLIESLELEKVSKLTEKMKNLKISATVNKGTYYLKRADITFDISIDNFSLPTGGDNLPTTEPLVFNFTISSELSNYNKQVVIVPPADAQDITGEIEKLTASFSKQAENAADMQTRNDIWSLSTELNYYYIKPGTGTYPKELTQLTELGYLKKIPTPPTESGVPNYIYAKDPANCEGTQESRCLQVAVYAPLTKPKNPGNVLCWQSSINKVQEMALNECSAAAASSSTTPSPNPSPTQGQEEKDVDSLNLLELDENILGDKNSWDLQLFNLFSSFFK